MRPAITGATRIAGVVGRPVHHSLSPLIHNAWLGAAGLDAAYVTFSPAAERFETFVEAQRGGALLGLNVTLPFKALALARADTADAAARAAGAANLLLFRPDGGVEARNTDGLGLLAAFAEQAPQCRLAGGVVAILGAGGAARGAAAAMVEAGARARIFNRTRARAEALAAEIAGATAFDLAALPDALSDVDAVINASSAAMDGDAALALPLERMRPQAVVMDMVYTPVRTPLLQRAHEGGLSTVDGLAMLIGQARPSFEALFGRPPPEIDVRALTLDALERRT